MGGPARKRVCDQVAWAVGVLVQEKGYYTVCGLICGCRWPSCPGRHSATVVG